MRTPSVIALVFAAFAPFAPPSIAGVDTHWDLAADWNMAAGNPNGQWSFGHMNHDFSNFTPFTNHAGDEWNVPGSGNIWKNTTGADRHGVPAGMVTVHPCSDQRPSVVRWTAPAWMHNRSIQVEGEFFAGDSGTMQVAVLRGSSVEFQATNAGGFTFVRNASAGDTWDFAVYGGWAFGNTPLALTVDVLPEPCPADVAGSGQSHGADGELTADDIIVFIGFFFGADVRADVAGGGQTVGADGQFTADDIIVFIGAFFAGC